VLLEDSNFAPGCQHYRHLWPAVVYLFGHGRLPDLFEHLVHEECHYPYHHAQSLLLGYRTAIVASMQHRPLAVVCPVRQVLTAWQASELAVQWQLG